MARRPPCCGAALAEYVDFLFRRGLVSATASTLVSAVLDRDGSGGAPRRVGERTADALAAFQRDDADRGPGQVVGIQWRDANPMAARAPARARTASPASCDGASLRDALLIRFMSDCLLRVGEAGALEVADLAFVGRDLRVTVRRSKTDQNGAGVLLYAGPPTVEAARRWLRASGVREGGLFRAVNKAGRAQGAGLSSRGIRDIRQALGGGEDRGARLRALAAGGRCAVAARGGRDDAGGTLRRVRSYAIRRVGWARRRVTVCDCPIVRGLPWPSPGDSRDEAMSA